jgi:nitrate reductase gamma subunit
MNMLEFARGPLVWIALLTFSLGSIYKILWIVLYSKKDKVVYPYMNVKYSLRSLLHWTIPFGSRNMRLKPGFTVFSFLFHICLLATPIFALGHIALWKESWGLSWGHLPDYITNLMSIIVVISIVILALRRIADPAVRFVTSKSDYLLLILIVSPFATGIMAYYQIFDYRTVLILHMWSGAIWLMAIPFTRIVHMLFFPFTRAYMGCEFGLVRNSKDW